jgi:uncharacterized protein (UPF0332 family)
MNGPDFLPLAARLTVGSAEAEWRTAVGRAYYAVFHVARQLLEDLGFRVPRADRCHAYLWMRLNNCGNSQVQRSASDLQTMRNHRNHADYDLHLPLRQAIAAADLQMARALIQVLAAAEQEPTRTQITDAMRIYERDVLRDVTWRKL